MTPRAAHTAIYDDETDSLYVFGGYNLNYVLDNLEIYRFNTSEWEDEYGTILGIKKSKFINSKIEKSTFLFNFLLLQFSRNNEQYLEY